MTRNIQVIIELHKHARESALELDDKRAFCEVMAPLNIVQPRLQALSMMIEQAGCHYTDGLPSAEEALATFFQEDAISLLIKSPNRYWFWKLVETVVIMELGTSTYYRKAKVLEAVAILRASRMRGTMGSVHNVESDGSGSRESQIAVRTAIGLAVLVPSTDGLSHYVADNPVFISDEFAA